MKLSCFFWEKHVVYADSISERTGVPVDDLYLMNPETTQDILSQLIAEENTMQTARFTDNVKSLFDRTGIRFNDASLRYLKQHCGDLTSFDLETLVPTGPNETVTEQDVTSAFSTTKVLDQTTFKDLESWEDPPKDEPKNDGTHPLFAQLAKCDDKQLSRFVDREHAALQMAYGRIINSAFWIAMIMEAPQGDMKYMPTANETRAAINWAVEGIDFYCYDGQGTRDRDPSRKSLSSKQYDIVNGNAENVLAALEHVNDLRAVGFQVENSFEDEYNITKARQLDKIRDRELMEQRAHDNRMAARATASRNVAEKLAGII